PGHGESEGPGLVSIEAMADWVLAVLERLEVKEARLVGHSMGALVALEAAARGGERIGAPALLGFTPGRPVQPDPLPAGAAGAHIAVDLMVSWSFAARSQLGSNLAPGLWLQGEAMRLLERAPAVVLAADLAACAAYGGAAAAAELITVP